MSRSVREFEAFKKFRPVKDFCNSAIDRAQRLMEGVRFPRALCSERTRIAFRGVHISPLERRRAIAARAGGKLGAGMLGRLRELVRDLREVPLSRTHALRILTGVEARRRQ